jgi:hypothetical protein
MGALPTIGVSARKTVQRAFQLIARSWARTMQRRSIARTCSSALRLVATRPTCGQGYGSKSTFWQPCVVVRAIPAVASVRTGELAKPSRVLEGACACRGFAYAHRRYCRWAAGSHYFCEAADKIYEALQSGPRGKRVRQANLSVDVARRAWKIVRRLYPRAIPLENPLEGTLKINTKQTKTQQRAPRPMR